MKLKTELLQEAVTKVYKGVGNDKLIPLTSLINILTSENSVLFTSTDSTNYFTTRIDDVECEPFEVSVNADVFTKLVQKMTSETISIEVLDTCLMVVGNGKYKIDLLIDETGEPVKFPDNCSDDEPKEKGELSVSVIRNIVANNKASLSASDNIPCLTNYYIGESVITTDRYKICKTEEKLLNREALISPTVMELLSTFSGDTINYFVDEKAICFDSEKEFLFAPIVDGVDKMPVSSIEELIKSDIPTKCILSKDDLMSVLDRLLLFVSPYDKNCIYLTFTGEGLSISSKKDSGSELIQYHGTEMNPFEAFTCAIDIEMLRSQLASISSDVVEMYFGSDIAIKFVDGNVTKIVALLEDDRID